MMDTRGVRRVEWESRMKRRTEGGRLGRLVTLTLQPPNLCFHSHLSLPLVFLPSPYAPRTSCLPRFVPPFGHPAGGVWTGRNL